MWKYTHKDNNIISFINKAVLKIPGIQVSLGNQNKIESHFLLKTSSFSSSSLLSVFNDFYIF